MIELLARALSIRQPHAENILLGVKKNEYRSRRTHIRGRVYIYAGKSTYDLRGGIYELSDDLLPRGLIVGTVEIVGCEEISYRWAWKLANPVRYAEPIRPIGQPQPGFWKPRF